MPPHLPCPHPLFPNSWERGRPHEGWRMGKGETQPAPTAGPGEGARPRPAPGHAQTTETEAWWAHLH